MSKHLVIKDSTQKMARGIVKKAQAATTASTGAANKIIPRITKR